MALKLVTVTTAATKTADTVASYNVYTDKPSAGTLVGTMTPAEASVGKSLNFTDGLNHNVTAKAVFTTAGESTLGSNIVVVDLSGWDLALAVYDNKFFDVSAIDTFPEGLYFKDDGTKFYMLGNTSNNLSEWTLSTPWDVSTSGSIFTIALAALDLKGLRFKDDGTKLYYVNVASQLFGEKVLSTAWDLSTAGATVWNVGALGNTGTLSFFMKPDGLKVWFCDNAGNIKESTLSTPWDAVSIAASATVLTPAEAAGYSGIFLKDDGTRMFLIGLNNGIIYQYDLSTAWDISTAVYNSISFDITAQNTSNRDLFIGNNGTKMYIAAQAGTAQIEQYSL